MHLVIATTKEDRARSLLARAAKARGIDVTRVYYADMVLPEPRINEWIRPDTKVMLRDPWNTGEDFSPVMRALLQELPRHTVLDERTLRERPFYEDKLHQARLFSKNLPIPKFCFVAKSPKHVKCGFPVVVKKRIASCGRGTFVLPDKKGLLEFFKKNDPTEYILQEFLKIDHDYRIIVLAGKILGVVDRKIIVHRLKGKKRIGVKVKGAAAISKAIERDAIKAAKLMGADFCGVDIVTSGDKHYVIECNVSPQFSSAQRVLKKDIAGMVVDFLMKK